MPAARRRARSEHASMPWHRITRGEPRCSMTAADAAANETCAATAAPGGAISRPCCKPGDLVDPLGRPRRRQDHLRPRADPAPRRRPRARGAEPDLHPDADLRTAARFRRARRPLPPRRAPANSPSSAVDEGPRTPWCCSNGRTARRGAAAGPARHPFTLAPRRARGAHGDAHRHGAFGRARAHRGDPPLPRRHRLRPRRARCTSRAMPRRAPTSARQARASSGHPDELAGAGPTGRRCAAASPTARSPISPRTSAFVAMATHGLRALGFSAPRIFGGDLRRPAHHRGSRRRAAADDPPAPIAERYAVRRRAHRAA